MRFAKASKEVVEINNYLFEGTDIYIKMDKSVQASVSGMKELLEIKYRMKVDFMQMKKDIKKKLDKGIGELIENAMKPKRAIHEDGE